MEIEDVYEEENVEGNEADHVGNEDACVESEEKDEVVEDACVESEEKDEEVEDARVESEEKDEGLEDEPVENDDTNEGYINEFLENKRTFVRTNARTYVRTHARTDIQGNDDACNDDKEGDNEECLDNKDVHNGDNEEERVEIEVEDDSHAEECIVNEGDNEERLEYEGEYKENRDDENLPNEDHSQVDFVEMDENDNGDNTCCTGNNGDNEEECQNLAETDNRTNEVDNAERIDDPYSNIRKVTDNHIRKIKDSNITEITVSDLMDQMEIWKNEMKKEINETLKTRKDTDPTPHPPPEPSSSSTPESVQREILAKDNKISLLQSKLVDKMELVSSFSSTNEQLQQEVLEKNKTISNLKSRIHQMDGHTLEHALTRIQDLEALSENLQQQNHLLAVNLEEKDNHLFQLQNELYRINDLYNTLYAEKAHLENSIRMLEVESACRCQPRSQLYKSTNAYRSKPFFEQTLSTDAFTEHHAKHSFVPPSNTNKRNTKKVSEPTISAKIVRFAMDGGMAEQQGQADEVLANEVTDDAHCGESSSSAKCKDVRSENFKGSRPENLSMSLDDNAVDGAGGGDVISHPVDVIIYHDSAFRQIPQEELMKDEGLVVCKIDARFLSDVVEHLSTLTSQPRAVLLHTGAEDIAQLKEDVVVENILEIQQLTQCREIKFIWSCILPTMQDSITNKKRQVVNALVSSKMSFIRDVTVVRHDDIDGDVVEGDRVGRFIQSIKVGICKSLGIAYAHLLKENIDYI